MTFSEQEVKRRPSLRRTNLWLRQCMLIDLVAILTSDLWHWKSFQYCQLILWIFVTSFIEIRPLSTEISRHGRTGNGRSVGQLDNRKTSCLRRVLLANKQTNITKIRNILVRVATRPVYLPARPDFWLFCPTSCHGRDVTCAAFAMSASSEQYMSCTIVSKRTVSRQQVWRRTRAPFQTVFQWEEKPLPTLHSLGASISHIQCLW